MALEIEQNQNQRTMRPQEEQNPLSQLVQPLLRLGLEQFSFGVLTAAVRSLHLESPAMFSAVRDSGGLTMPSLESMLLNQKIEDRAASLAAAA